MASSETSSRVPATGRGPAARALKIWMRGSNGSPTSGRSGCAVRPCAIRLEDLDRFLILTYRRCRRTQLELLVSSRLKPLRLRISLSPSTPALGSRLGEQDVMKALIEKRLMRPDAEMATGPVTPRGRALFCLSAEVLCPMSLQTACVRAASGTDCPECPITRSPCAMILTALHRNPSSQRELASSDQVLVRAAHPFPVSI